MNLTDFIFANPELTTWVEALTAQERHLLSGVNQGVKPLILQKLIENQRDILVVTADLYRAQRLVDELERLDLNVYLFGVEEMLAAELATSSPEFKSQRLQAMHALLNQKQPKIVVVNMWGLKRYLPAPSFWQQNCLTLTVGQQIDLEKTVQQLIQMGYRRQKIVERPGDFALRGSILDVFALNLTNPVRIDLFDDEIDSLRYFDSSDQRSIENLAAVEILPASELLTTPNQLKQAQSQLFTSLQACLPTLKKEDQEALQQRLAPLLQEDLMQLPPQALLFGAKFVGQTTLLDYLNEDGYVIFDDYVRLLEKESQLLSEHEQWLLDYAGLVQAQDLNMDLRQLEKKVRGPKIFLTALQKGMGRLRFKQKLDLKARAVSQFFGQMPLFKTELTRWQKQKQTVVLTVSPTKIKKMAQTLQDFEIAFSLTTEQNILPQIVQLVPSALSSGFEIAQLHLIVLTENELLAKKTKKVAKKNTLSNAERLKSYTDLKPGDYVVHVNHGIGLFEGMQTLEVQGKHQDYLTLVYQNQAKLFIPVSQLDRVQKYVSSESKVPKINKLGTNDWHKTKQKVANKIEDIADELVELYAKREAEKGFAFSKDNEYQQEFEDAFAYSETPDQLRSATEIKQDMQKARPMDRLLIGDVGYGKTEVALRAAFKAIQDGKQVAFLVPTTVLAQQHYENIINRFEGFPVNIGLLSRFSTPKEVKQTLADLKNGMCDLVVGTHRLLSKDVVFSDLGLLIIDEEQRFGVKHKERLKTLKANVDVLTLTATPIPRTLNMSMLGVRDLSVIETAPLNRYPIQTYVLEENPAVIADAIERELAREGQVFYLHNRVEDIEKVTAFIKQLVPTARVAYIHGQMSEAQLERILYAFIEREYDVLVTTTIIETGVDIPNANTLLVENADYMGLAQLYQLRGRVGRSNRVAYAYFMYQPNKVLTEVSEKRLEAIKDFTELGSGFKIAMRDLAIRGAGNLLGKQQHGFIDSVGYDLYTQMLNEAVNRKRGKKALQKTDSEISLQIEAYLPASYIEDPRQKIDIYKRIRQFENKEQYLELQADLLDRFGQYPSEVANLLEIGLIKMWADLALVAEIKQTKQQITVILSQQATKLLDAQSLLKATAKTRFGATLAVKKDQMHIKLVIQPKMTLPDVLEQLQLLLADLVASLQQLKKNEAGESHEK